MSDCNSQDAKGLHLLRDARVQHGSIAGSAPQSCGQGRRAQSITAPLPRTAPCTHLEILIRRMLWGALAKPLSKLRCARLPELSLAWQTLTDWPGSTALSKLLAHRCFSLPDIPPSSSSSFFLFLFLLLLLFLLEVTSTFLVILI